MKKRYLPIMIALWITMILSLVACAYRSTPSYVIRPSFEMQPSISSLHEVPGITEEEIQAIEELRTRFDSFVYGVPLSTEAFYNEQGELSGFTALLCDWLSTLIGIEFKPVNVEFADLFTAMETNQIDFTGGLAPSPERKLLYHMTDPIIERTLVYFRLSGSPPLYEILKSRPVKLAFLEGSATTNLAMDALPEGTFEPIFIKYNTDAIDLILSGEVDGFVHQNTTKIVFEQEPNIISSDFYPPTFASVSLTARRDELAPVIQVIQRSLTYEQRLFLNNIYRQGELQFIKRSFHANLTAEEKAFIENTNSIPFAAEFSNYPVSFYDRHQNHWSGVVMDILEEISQISGLQFDVVNQPGDGWTSLLDQLKSGEAWMISELIYTADRSKHFLWADLPIIQSKPAMISSTALYNINLNDVLYTKIGIVAGSAYDELMGDWFPNASNIVYFDNNDSAIDALINDDIEMIFMNEASLLNLTNYRELPDFKVNLRFEHPITTTFGFNKEQELLQSIVSKALRYVNILEINNRWLNVTFDYRVKVAEAQLPWIVSSTVLVGVILTLIIFFMYRKQVEGRRLALFQRSVIATFADLIESRDVTTGKHITNVQKYFVCLINQCIEDDVYKDVFSKWNIDEVSFAAELHDVGKINISDVILNKPGKLTEEEYEIMKTHTIVGSEIIDHMAANFKNIEMLQYAKNFAVAHHEWWDGSGYPYGLKGEDIPIEGRVLAIVDVYDALVSERPYKKAFSAEDAARIIQEDSGTHFDPRLVEVFLQVQECFGSISRS